MSNLSRRLKSMFSSQKKVWQQLAYDIQAEYIDQGLFKSTIIKKQSDYGEIVLDSYRQTRGRHQLIYTRFICPVNNPHAILFKVDRKTMLNKKAPKGMESILTEHTNFDHFFRLFGSRKREVNQILSRKILGKIAEQQPFKDLSIELKENEIILLITPLNKDLIQLKAIFRLLELLQVQLDYQI